MIDGEKIGADLGEWEHALDYAFVKKVHLAMAIQVYPDGEHIKTYSVHGGKQYFSDERGTVWERVK